MSSGIFNSIRVYFRKLFPRKRRDSKKYIIVKWYKLFDAETGDEYFSAEDNLADDSFVHSAIVPKEMMYCKFCKIKMCFESKTELKNLVLILRFFLNGNKEIFSTNFHFGFVDPSENNFWNFVVDSGFSKENVDSFKGKLMAVLEFYENAKLLATTLVSPVLKETSEPPEEEERCIEPPTEE